MNRRMFLAASALLAVSGRAFAAPTTIEVYKNAGCGCCSAWIDHLRLNGYAVRATDVRDASEYRRRYGIPDALGSCHTARVDGYAIEGHVPAREIRRLLAERPDAIGLTVPGMPLGSPGMEQGGRVMPYEVLLIDRRGRTTVYSRYGETPRS